ncbi:MAG: YcaO-like family protein [Desulfococcaceae bacterium]|jgi:ribosomal protein S12 methylthiotransferase accessory factor|nr:YcaO-like family protein [Desulfococcaceae bacterium]
MSRIILQDAFKQETFDQDKIITPEETVRHFKQKMKKAGLDILEKAVRIDNGRLDIPVYFSTCGPDALALTGSRKQMGKGATPQQAEASAVMELAERFSFFSYYKNQSNFIRGEYRNLKDRALPFVQIRRSVHDMSEDAQAVYEIFSSLPMRWAEGYNLSQDREVLIPIDWFYTINEFNGSCAGNGPEEAICQGICEVAERHVSSLVSRGRLRVPRIRPDSAKDAAVMEMMEKYARAGVRLYLSDFSLDTGIPTVGVLACDPQTFPESSEIVWTAGTSPDPQKALSRALSETAQLGGDFNSGSNYLASGLPKFARMEDADFIINEEKEVDIQELPDLSHRNIKREIENLLHAFSRKQMEVLVINTAHPRLQIPAYYVMIPGTHFRERAENSSVGMFCAKLISEQNPPLSAISQLRKMEERLPNKYYIRFFLGTSHLALGETKAALRYLEEALMLNPPSQVLPDIYSYTGLCLKEREEYKKALDVLEKGEMLDPERTDIHNLRGFCYFKLKEHEKAVESFRKVLDLNPSSAIDHANIAVNYREMGQKEKAIAWFETALAMDPSIDFARESLQKLKGV